MSSKLAPILMLLTAACAEPLRSDNLALPLAPTEYSAPPPRLLSAVSVVPTIDADGTGPTAEQGALERALSSSLSSRSLLASGMGKYILEAKLVALRRPVLGLSVTATAEISYRLRDLATREILFADVITSSSSASVGDALSGSARIRMASEAAIRRNFALMIESMVRQFVAGPLAGGTNDADHMPSRQP